MRYWDVFLGSSFLGCVQGLDEDEAWTAAVKRFGHPAGMLKLKELQHRPAIL